MRVVDGLYLGMGFSVMCADEFDRIRDADIGAETAGTFLGAAPSEAIVDVCSIWPKGQILDEFHEPVVSDVPALVISGALDPTTPARWGEEAASSLANSLHLVQPGIAHSPFSDCALGVMGEMIDAGSVESLDVSCVLAMERPPFELDR